MTTYRETPPSSRPVAPAGLPEALAHLEQRWGNATVRLGNGRRVPAERIGAFSASPSVEGALAPAVAPVVQPDVDPLAPLDDRVISTGFPELDAILGPGGLVREANVTLRGGGSSGKTTLALRLIAETQRHGGIAAYLDLGGCFDPIEAVARGVDLEWLLVLRVGPPAGDANGAADERAHEPASIEGFRLAGALLGGRTVDLLVVDLPDPSPVLDEWLLRRLAARARRVGSRLVVLEPLGVAPSLHGALAETAGVGLELERRGWIRVGRDVVGQLALVTVTKNRFGSPGRRAQIEIRYVDEGDRERGVGRLLDEQSRLRDERADARSQPGGALPALLAARHGSSASPPHRAMAGS
jgi:hypothetical protein